MLRNAQNCCGTEPAPPNVPLLRVMQPLVGGYLKGESGGALREEAQGERRLCSRLLVEPVPEGQYEGLDKNLYHLEVNFRYM